jgi:hypothetical protein
MKIEVVITIIYDADAMPSENCLRRASQSAENIISDEEDNMSGLDIYSNTATAKDFAPILVTSKKTSRKKRRR